MVLHEKASSSVEVCEGGTGHVRGQHDSGEV